MKRADIEKKLSHTVSNMRTKIQDCPLTAVLSGIGVGIILMLFPRVIITTGILATFVVWAFWFFSETEEIPGDGTSDGSHTGPHTQ